MKRICVLIPTMVLICQLAFSTTYTVTNTSDVGTGSLRQAVTDANVNPGADIINFQIAGSGPHIIQITSALIITDPVTIDGYSENGTYPAGANFPAKIKIVIDGLNGFFGSFMGIQVSAGGSGSTIQGLAIVNFDQFGQAGIYLNGCNNVIVAGNYLGIQPDGTTIAGNNYGIYLDGADNSTVGGSSVASGNIISGNLSDGVHLELNAGISGEALNNIIQFNWIGTDNLGTLDKGNGQYGIYINNGDGCQVLDNIISGNDNSGIYIGYSGANKTTGVTIQRNKIGVNSTNATLGNNGYGIYIAKATTITIGGSVANNNVIANNSYDGIYVAPASSGIDISANSIYSNGELGIDLDPNGVNPLNIAGPYATAVNPPEIDSAKVNGVNLTLYCKIVNLASTTYYVEFFRNNFSLGADPSGYGEGQTYIGNTTVTTNGSGTVSFSVTIAGAALYKDYISGTSKMVSTGNTSEFAFDKQVKSRIDTIAFGSGKYIRSYCIPPVPGATSYTWTVAPLANIQLGQGTTCITVDYAGSVAGNYEVCVVANNSCGPSDNSCFPVQIIELTLSGNVYNDANGMNGGNKVDGPGIGIASGSQLYASLISGGTVYETVAVNPDGTYTFINLDNTLDFSVVLTTINTPAGNPAPAATLPSGWVNTGEINNDAGNTLTGNDGLINGIVSVGLVPANETNVNFGIDQLPNSTDASASYTNPGGTNKVTSPTLTGSDPEDGPLGSGKTLKITTLATNGILYYDGIAVTLNQVITSYDPTKLKVDPIDGNVTVTFQFAFIDAAGFEDPTPATATLTFTDLTITGEVHDDNDGLTDNTVDGSGTNAGNTVYANLVSSTNIVLASVAVPSGGIFSFGTADGVQINTSYKVILTNGATSLGSTLTTATLPTNWVSTGEFLGTGAGNDGSVNSILPVSVVTSSVTDANLGIEQLPNSDNASASYPNPGGTNTVIVPTLTGSDPEDGTYGSGNTFKVTSLAVNGILYYNNIAVTLNQVITNYDPTKLKVDPIDGDVVVTFQYAFIDAAGNQDPTPATATLTFFNLTIAGTNVSCFGGSNGTASVTVLGGTTPYSYYWSNGQTTNPANGLSAGTYTVSVTDFNGSSASASISITQPGAVIAGIIVQTNVSCFGGSDGSATVTAYGGTPSGGNGGYSYLWNNGKTTQTIANLTAGNYQVTVTDVNSCSGTAVATVTQPLLIIANAGPDQILCNKTSTFLVGNDPSPGTGNWTTLSGPNNPAIFPSNSSVAIAAGLIPGIYKFVYTVTVGPCSMSDTMMVTDWHSPSVAIAGPDQQLCKSAAGPDSTYLNANVPVWGNGKWTEMAGPNIVNFVNPYNPATKVKNLIDGIYDFRWSIGNGTCDSSFADMHVTVHTMPTAYAGPDTTICGSSLDTLKYSSASNYSSLLWITTGSGYFNNTGILHPVYVPSAADIAAGSVKLILKATGFAPCGIVRDTMVLTLTPPPLANAGPDGSICEFSDFCLCGATAYHYTNVWWTTTGCGTFNDPNILNPVYTPCPADLVTGCIKLVLHVMGIPPCGEVTDTMELCIRRIPVVYAGPDTTICSQGTYTVNLSTALYQASLLWKTSGDGTFDKDTILHPTYTPGTGDLITGHVTLTLIGIACSPCPNDTDEMVLTFSYPPVVHAFVITNVSCFGGNNGSVMVTLTGGKSPYYYLWSDPAQQTTQTATGLIAGTYTVTVTDYYHCTATSSATVTEPPLLTVQCTPTHISCYTYADGTVTITAGGGTPGYSYWWSNGKTTQNISGLTAGTYTVTVTDTHGCTTVCSSTVTQPPPWGPQICGLDTVCQGTTVQYCVCEPLRPGSTYEWTVTCGTIIDGCCGPCVTIKWDHCAHGTICVTETRHDAPYDGCIITTCKTIILKPVPAPAITGPSIVNAGQTGAVYCTPYYPGHLYSWSVIDGTVTAGQGTNCITVTWNSTCNNCMGQVIAYETENGCCGTDTMNVTIIPGTGNLDGYVMYKNPYNTGLNGVAVTLRNSSGVVIATVYSGPNPVNSNQAGYYAFPGIPDGSYHVTAGFNGAWGGNNSTDALIIELYTVSLYPLNGLNLKVGDANNDFIANATDALWVKLRTVGMVNSYPAGDWKFTDTTFTLTGTATVNLQGLCVGDVNGSYIPTGTKESSYLSVIEDGIMTVAVNQDFEYPIRSNIFTDLGAMTLFMGYDPVRYEVEEVITPLEGMKYVIRDGEVRLAWSNTTPIKLRENDPVLTLKMRVKETVSVASQIFEVKPGSEFADAGAFRYDDFILKMSGVVTPDNPAGYSITNFPNPFQNTTDIVYTLPEKGHVKLILTNLFGEELRTLVSADQVPGTYTVRVDPSEYNIIPGIYFYRIKVDGETTTYGKINKMIFTR